MLTQKQQKLAAKAFYQHWKDKQGYEKGETQAFWNMLLRDIFGVAKTEDIIEYEKTVQSKSRNFIDAYIAPTKILIEQKSADKDLLKPAKQSDGSMLTPYQQAKRYADELPLSAKPRYIIACNFREFHIHDMEKPQEPPQIVLLKDLQKEYHRLSFIIDNHSNAHIQKEVELSIEAGKIVGLLYDAIARQYKDMSNPKSIESLNKLCVRLVFCLYAEDTDIFHAKDAFRDYLLNHSPQSMRQALIDLFTVLNTPQNLRQNLYLSDDCLQFPYANGGLFTGDIEIPLMNDEIYRLITTTACEFDWSEISPTIFGAVFESTLNPETRRSGGMHYTSIENIHKVIDPLFLDDIKDELAQILQLKQKATIMKRVAEFQHKLASLTFLDPAAGSGNFLTETYISLRRIENQALAFAYGGQKQLIDPIKVSISQFYGIEINDFAVSVAQTALWIAEIQSKHQTEEIFSDSQIEYLPLKTHATFVEGNALRLDWNSVIPASELNYIMGNPPFIGYSLQNKAQKDDLLSVLIDENGKPLKTAGKVDYVAGWYYKACGFMQGTNIQAAFVSTNSICQGEQPAFVFKYLKERYQIQFNFAYRTFRWDSEAYDKAAVHCVIIGFSLSGSLKNNRNAVGWASLPTNNANTHAVIASEQSERGNLPATENAPNNNNDKAVGWACQPTTTPTGVDNTNIITDNANIDFAPNGAMVGKDAHPTTETTTAVGWASQPTNNAAGVDNADNFRQPENQPAVGWASQPTIAPTGANQQNDLRQTTPDGVAVGKNAHPIKEAPTLSGSLKENTPLDLPELNAQNWHIIVQKLTPELGANVLLAQHSSLVKVEDNQITLSVHKSGELFCKPAHLSALGEVLAHHYGTQQKIQLIEWQDNFEHASQAKQRHKEEEQQQRLIELQQDPFAQKLQQVFGGVWTVSS
ncbi:MAG: hypothetical protein IJ187_10585 [Neisseriaceae bacterium]|nr:hypothetical protein [Neisseriaceae bacterium]